MQPVVIVVLVLGLVIGINLAVWIPIVAFRRRRVAVHMGTLQAEIASNSGEQILRGPSSARYRRGHVSSRGVLVLTNQRLLFVGLKRLDIPLLTITALHMNTSFKGEYRSGAQWLIMSTSTTPDEIAFMPYVSNSEWLVATEQAQVAASR
jgi:hypothetical protein